MVHIVPGPQAPAYDVLMDAAWPALERRDTGEWVLRAAAGVTQRANSVWPRDAAEDPVNALREAVRWYRERRLPLIFQVTETPANAGLNRVLDGPGGGADRETARRILAGCPSLYALVRDDDGVPAAVGRLAMVHGTGGIYCMATSPSARRRGYAATVLQALLAEGGARGVDSSWLLVTAANHAARQLYSRAGFTESGRYVYRQQWPRRALTGC